MTSSSKDTNKTDFDDLTPRIGIIGVGGAGGNAINNMIQADLAGVNFLAANTDAQALAATLASHSLQLGTKLTSGLGSGAQVNTGRAAAEESADDIRKWVSQYDLLFIAAGMGGGTGTGAAPIIAEIAREENTLSVAVITLPFDFEGSRRMRAATEGLRELEKLVDTLIIIPNQNLFAVANATTTLASAFTLADEVLHDAIRSITDLIVLPGLINLDFADVKAVITKTGRAMMGTGIGTGASRAIDAAEAAIANPLLETVSIKGAKGLLINVTGGPDMTLFEIDEAANRIRAEVGGDSLVIFGSAFDPTLEGNLRVSVVATGLSGLLQQSYPEPEPEPVIEPEPEPAELKEKLETTLPPPIAPAMEAVMEAIIEHASKEPEYETHTPKESQQIPAPTMPRSGNPRPHKTPEPSIKIPTPEAKTPKKQSAEAPTHDEPKATEKKNPKFGWAKKIFSSD
jgi:cell division protein FtsZ